MVRQKDYTTKRKELVSNFIKPVVSDEHVIDALSTVPRHEFVSRTYKKHAYKDYALPIGNNQTISQPSLVAMMSEKLNLTGKEKVLEIGTGSGYQAAILSLLADRVYTIERIKSLADRARKTLMRLKYKNVTVICGDGTKGYMPKAPYDAIMVTAYAQKVPRELTKQLKEGGRIVIPVGREYQRIVVGTKKNGKMQYKKDLLVAFVPLVKDT